MTRIYTTYPEAWELMLEDCRVAKSYIYFEQFIWQDFGKDGIGAKFLEVFKRKVKEGVQVRLIVDAVGSIGLSSNILRQREIAAAGIEMIFFGLVPRWQSLFPFSLFHRDHRKLMVIDDAVTHMSGVIIGDRARDWMDLGVRVTDARYVSDAKGAFLRMWDEIRGTKEHLAQYNDDNGLMLSNDPENNELYDEILHRVRHAKHKISIVTPYLSPDWRMMRALRRARRRGVAVEIYIPTESDSKLTGMVTQSYLRPLYRAKIDVYRCKPCMNHGKMVIVDDWVTLGSMNFDRLSFFYNRELNFIFPGHEADFEGVLRGVRECSEKLQRDDFTNRGLKFAIEVVLGKLLRPIA